MNEYANPYTVAAAQPTERAEFIRKTYIHLAGAILAFIGVEAFFFTTGLAETIATALMSVSWLFVIAGFIGVSWIADRWARSDASIGKQYLGLGLFIVAEAIIFVPLLFMATYQANDPQLIAKAGGVTGFLFLGLTAVALITRKDFSFLRSFIMIGSFVALGVIVVGTFTGFSLGTWFSAAMILIAAGSILYTTSNMIHYYRTDQYVAASLSLFSGVALLFWYILQLFMSRD